MTNEKAIELLTKDVLRIEDDGYQTISLRGTIVINLVAYDQALSLLQRPKPFQVGDIGELIKELRRIPTAWKSRAHVPMREIVDKTCDKLQALSTKIEQLEEENAVYLKCVNEREIQNDNFRKQIKQFEAEVRRLTKERNRLFVLNEAPKNLPSKCGYCGRKIDYKGAGFSDS